MITEPPTEPLTMLKRKIPVNQRLTGILSGERGIRTPGASQHDGFQDRCNRPLYHLSLLLRKQALVLKRCKGMAFFRNCQNYGTQIQGFNIR